MARDREGLDEAVRSVCSSRADEKRRAEDEVERGRRRRIEELKRQVREGDYSPDLKDIARLLTSAMDPTL
ncbi:flagellar biosynthesis anti-sigma factor FlgM [Desulfovibrio oxyclinae]|uniref:flagellar biosynthesis anti-sigma factor FlgM n=1 Tax=Desulfovibrio oxyclinae TaxID=63560 RepID=UPI0003688173|nr:flagellar biosynthesis anti-sigma factor FlgM [Desulfovibrio oxyclinae]